MLKLKKYFSKINSSLSSIPPLYLISGSLGLFLLTHFSYSTLTHLYYHEKGFIGGILEMFYNKLEKLPITSTLVDKEKQKLLLECVREYAKDLKVPIPDFKRLPENGVGHKDLIKLLKDANVTKFDLSKVSAANYMPFDKDHTKAINEAYLQFSDTNCLHFDLTPALSKFEREIIMMTKQILYAPEKARGVVTSGGTESLIMALKAYRDYYKVKKPNVVIPESTHPAVDKGCSLLGIECRKAISDQKTLKVDLNHLKQLIDKNTIMILGSAPNYPNGVIDDIPELGKIAIENKIALHVDSCLGGFYLPFAKRLDIKIDDFDFRVKGVTSISADSHKFGGAPKGTSVLIFKNIKLRNHCFYTVDHWIGGQYATTTIGGSRNGGIVAACWASLITFGMSGFLEQTKNIHKTVTKVKKRIQEIPEIEIPGDPQGCLLSFRSTNKKISIYQVMDEMRKHKWRIDGIKSPAGMHFCFTSRNVGRGDDFIKDLKKCIVKIKKNPKIHMDESASMYGSSVIAPKKLISEIANGVLGYTLDGTL